MTDEASQRQIFTISQLNRRARILLETHLSLLWVRGEISNLARPGSGHWYFTLKDSDAQVRCAMFRNRNGLVRFQPKDGDQVLVRGRVGLYENRGEYQLIAEHMEADGAGLLQQQYEALKLRLQGEGLFDPAHKQPLPPYPGRIGVITSPTGAAVRDILHVTARRCPWLEMVILPTQVQGREAAGQIIAAIEFANRQRVCDLLIVTRGGGSIEDLWCFNEEAVARAIFASAIPIISAVGHETDFTIADFVADLRAPTPSAAAEMATPDGDALAASLQRLEGALARRTAASLELRSRQLQHLAKRLRSPVDKLREQSQNLDHLEIRLRQAWQRKLAGHQGQLALLKRRLDSIHPDKQLALYQTRVAELEIRLNRGATTGLTAKRQRLQGLAATLNAVSPLNTLDRGYALARDSGGRLLRSVAGIQPGDDIEVKVRDGAMACRVEEILPDTQKL